MDKTLPVAPRFAVNQAVLVLTWRGEEQPGTILSVPPPAEDPHSTGSYMVRLLIAEETVACAASQLRELTTEDAPASSSSVRRSRRTTVTPSPPTQQQQSKTGNRKLTKKNNDSSVTTPTKRKKAEVPAAVTVSPMVTATSSPHFARQKDAPTKPTKRNNKRKTTQPASSNTAARVSKERSDTQSLNAMPICQPIADDSDTESVTVLRRGHNDADADDDSLDRPFTVSYAPTSRARCARCDTFIVKGELRITHKPLFRGKQGFQVSRHLHCAVFSEDIDKAEDVGGWKSLASKDYCALTMRVEESKFELEEEKNELQPDELVKTIFHGETRAPPEGLVASLLPFQVEGVSWMYHQETQVPEIRGGILADEMGMGKTLQTITTIVDNRPLLQHSKPGLKHPPSAIDIDQRRHEESLWSEASKNWKTEMDMVGVPDTLLRPKKGSAGCRAGTLVVCPLIALSQWKTEIEKFTAPGTLSIGVYHGTSRATDMPAKLLQKYDIVLTTYQVLEQDFRKMISPNKIACPNCGGKYKIDKLRVHLKYFCGDGAERTEAQARQRRNGDRGSRPSGRKTAPMPSKKTIAKKAPLRQSKTLKVKSSQIYDSESDLSVGGDVEQLGGSKQRPSRSAATSASKKLARSVKDWGAKAKVVKADSDDDDSAYSEVSEDEDEDESDDDSSGEGNATKRRKIVKDDNAGQALARAKQRQAEALAATKKNKKMPNKKDGKGKPNKKKGKKKKKMGKDADSDSTSSSDDEEKRDPLEGIDLDALTKQAMEGSQLSLLHSVCWWRVVLDEAHFIKSRSSQTSHAAFSLTALHRWCLSGTPLQNRVGELYSLIRFLRISPMAHYFCRMKDCNCQSIHYRMKQGVCQDCSHRQFSHYSHFNKHVLTPIQRDGYTGDGRRAMFKLKNEVLDKCLLRRTKETKAEDMNLPPRIVRIKYVRLHPIEEDFYQGLYTRTKASFNDYVEEGTLLNNYAHIFDLLTKMRQAVDHPYLLIHSRTNHMKLGGKSQVANGSVDCMMCHETPTERVVSSCCGAGFCRSCVIEYIAGGGGETTPCPSCEEPFTIDLNQKSVEAVPSPPPARSEKDPVLKDLPNVATTSILRRINLAEFATSTKIEVLIQSLVEMRKERPGGKALVFSQFVNMLDLVRWRLHSDPFLSDLGLGVRILHGGMDVKSRDAALKSFREDSECRVLLMSLKAAGVALNLTVASECYLLDLWWNPAAEMQAIDRCHRLGQHRPIRAVRFVAEGTVEERVLQLQEKKRLVFDGTVGRDAGSLKMLTVNDMKSLFS